MTGDEVMAELNAVRELPPGLSMYVHETGNIIITGRHWAFCITPKAIEDGIHTQAYAKTLDVLLLAEQNPLGAEIFSLHHLHCEDRTVN